MNTGGTLLIAWRGLWRNKRRSFLTISSIAVGLAAVMFGQSLLRSFQMQMIDKSTGIMLGHLQVQRRGVRDRKVPDKLLSGGEGIRDSLAADPRVAAAGIRLLYTGLAQAAGGSRAILVVGVEPSAERELSILPGYLKEGEYLGEDPRGVVLGAKLAAELDVRLGERLVLMAQAPGGDMNSELFRVSGLFETGSVNYDSQVVYIGLGPARRLRDRLGRASHVVLKLRDPGEIDAFHRDHAAGLEDPEAELLTYREVGSEVAGIKKFQDALLIVILIIIFAIVGLGIQNTISMSFFERIREFGVVRALGARPSVVRGLLLTEAAFMGTIGAVLGFLLGLGLIGFFGVQGLELPLGRAMAYFIPFDNVIYMRPIWEMHLWSAAGVFLVSVATSIGPALRASRLIVAEALRHV